MKRRQLCGLLATAGLLARIEPVAATQPIIVQDMAGREVALPALPRRIVLLEAHDLLTMSLLHPDPASLVVGWAAVDRIDSALMETRLRNGHHMSVVGKQSPDTISIEGLIGLMPDLVVTTAFMTPGGDADPLVERLRQLDIPVVFSDASMNAVGERQSMDPLAELRRSMRMWGTIVGASDKADAFVTFCRGEFDGIAARLSTAPLVTTYLEVQSTADDCCWAAGRKIWGDLLTLAGGQPLPGVTAPWFEKLSLEYLLSTPHDVYIASGGGWVSGSRPAIGPGIEPERGRQGLRQLIEARPGFDSLSSVRGKRVYGIWTGLISNLPLNVLFVAQAAKWLHPDRCADLAPDAVLETINTRFAAFPIEGPLWVSL